ncbi:MAG: isochorismatase family protein [Phycisphaerae bacterium]
MDHQRILLDIESQRDFFSPDGECYTAKAGLAAENIERLFDWAKEEVIPVISTVLRVRSGEIGPLTSVPHCIEGTLGEKKMAGSLMPRRINLGLRNSTDLPKEIFEKHQQVIIEKRDTDIFAHARAERLITELTPGTVIVCGAGIGKGIYQATVGLRARGFGVVIAEDAVVDLDDEFAEMAMLRMQAKGAVPTATSNIVSPQGKRARKNARFRSFQSAG